ncbi:DUF937 domain-containing protein [Sandaracinobacter sp. RS1-74]|uniref:DUF937 domain-containing protein n=1 Tax=Sandaracinobacteroides sayramensis TaxID=2913411 RepID=UPI001EDAA7ED|nr:DUF937 domain-containing protein [Sandaracinobacteroides sayramensis]MCG2841727.1 DUF937 domain-containing protein [Sandaracinobacteroides sayramensis]
MSNTILEALGGAGGLAQIASELGIDQQTAMTGAAALLPAVLGGFKKQAQAQPNGLEGLVGMLGGMGGGGLLDAVLAPKATPVDQGNAVLGQIFGSKDVSREVAGQAAGASGLSADLLKKLLPVVAMAAAGMMAKSASAAPAQEGGLGGLVGQVLGGLTGGQPAAAGGLGGLVGMLDLNGDGNPLDDILGMAQRLGR